MQIRNLSYRSALQSINTLIASCDYETQRKLIKYIYEHGPDYRSEWDRRHNILSSYELREIIIANKKSRVTNPTAKVR